MHVYYVSLENVNISVCYTLELRLGEHTQIVFCPLFIYASCKLHCKTFTYLHDCLLSHHV